MHESIIEKKAEALFVEPLISEDEFFITFEVNSVSTAQLLYYRAVVQPELEAVVRKHVKNLMELAEREVK